MKCFGIGFGRSVVSSCASYQYRHTTSFVCRSVAIRPMILSLASSFAWGVSFRFHLQFLSRSGVIFQSDLGCPCCSKGIGNWHLLVLVRASPVQSILFAPFCPRRLSEFF